MKKSDTLGVRLSGVTIRRVTGHNAFFIKNGFRSKESGKPVLPIGPGAIIKIIRSGDVIPHVLEVLKGAKSPQMPKEAYTWSASGVDIVQSESSDLADMKRVTYFFTKLDVEGLRMGTMEKLFNAGLNTILKIAKAPQAAFLKIDGIQDRTATKLRVNIDQALSKTGLAALMDASGLFGALGEKRLTLVLKAYPDILARVLTALDLHALVVAVPGFQSVLADQFVAGLPKFKVFYAKLGVTAQAPKVVRAKGTAFKNAVVIFTGFRDTTLEAKIVEQGGTIGSAINSKTTLLVVKDLNAASSKIVKARSLGIEIISGQMFKKNLDKL